MTSRGFSRPPFRGVVFGPVVHLDPDGDDPPDELHDKTLADVVRVTKHELPR